MTFIEKLKAAYIEGNWDGVGEVLEMLGSPVKLTGGQLAMRPMDLTEEDAKQIDEAVKKKKGRPKATKPEPVPVVKKEEDFKVKNQTLPGIQSWEDTPRVHKNSFIDDKQDLKNAPKYKPKGSKKTYVNEEEYLREKVYPKTRSMPARPAVTKVQMTCAKCNKTEELYPSTITYSDIETRTWKCNDCSAKG